MRKRIFNIMLFLFLLAVCLPAGAAKVTDVHWGINSAKVLRFTLDVTEKTDYQVKLDGRELQVQVDASLVRGINHRGTTKSALAPKYYLDRQDGKTVLRIPLQQDITEQQYKSFTLKKDVRHDRPPRIVLDITAGQRSLGSYAPSAEPTAIDYRTSGGLQGKVVVIDPGHGGTDPGAIGPSGLQEKYVTMGISQQLQKYLQNQGAKVFLTRTTDVDVYGADATDRQELQARVDVGTEHKADIFVSIHINANNSPSVGGFSTYYTPKSDYDYKLARCVHSSIISSFGLEDLGVREAGFYVTKHSLMPAILVENCFISNPKEERLLASSWFQGKIAKTIGEGIANYFA